MSKKKPLSLAVSWRMCLIALSLLVLAQLCVIWFDGGRETRQALVDGRRFLIALDSGDIQGKTEPPVVDAQPEHTALPEKPAENPPEATAAETPPPLADQAEHNGAPEEAAPVVSVPETVSVETGKNVEIVPETAEEELPPIAPSISAPHVVSAELIEKSELGSLPRISGGGEKPWKFYAKPFIRKGNKPMIAIIVTGLGPSKRINDLAIRLPEPMALSFSPYTRDLPNWTGAARLAGHELLLDLPAEPVNYPADDPGPLALLVSKDQMNNEMRLKKAMATTTGYMGFVTPQDEVVTADGEIFKSLLHVLSGRGLMLVVGKQPHKTETRDNLDSGNTPNLIADTLVDEELTPTAIQARLSSLEQTAKSRGFAVGIAQAYPLTIEQLNEWAEKLEENGFSLVPISLVMMQRHTQ